MPHVNTHTHTSSLRNQLFGSCECKGQPKHVESDALYQPHLSPWPDTFNRAYPNRQLLLCSAAVPLSHQILSLVGTQQFQFLRSPDRCVGMTHGTTGLAIRSANCQLLHGFRQTLVSISSMATSSMLHARGQADSKSYGAKKMGSPHLRRALRGR